MSRLTGLALLTLSIGCASQTPDLTLRVESARTTRLAPEVRRQLEDADAASLRDQDRELDRGRERVATARKALSVARAEPAIPDAAYVHEAKVSRAGRELEWEEAVLRSAEWRRASTASAGELAKAEALARAGDDVDVGAYAAQHERMRAGLTEALRRQAAQRASFDESERQLAAAKTRYAQAHGNLVTERSPAPR
jgi:hypothetical protein